MATHEHFLTERFARHFKIEYFCHKTNLDHGAASKVREPQENRHQYHSATTCLVKRRGLSIYSTFSFCIPNEENIHSLSAGYKSSFRNIDGNMNTDMDEFAPKEKGQIALFSSQGPTYEELTKPDVTAPGVSINAAFNSYVEITDKLRKELTDKVDYNGKTYYYTAQSGTSMATPVVAGAIALWLQANPTLTTEQIKDVFAHTCTHPEENLDYPNNIYGHGQIDVYKGLLYILDLPNSIPELSQQQPAEARFSLQDRRLSVHLTDGAPLSHSTASLAIYTTDGRMVRTMLLDSDMSADLSTLPAGLYAVQLTTSHRQTTGSTLIRLK